MTTSRLVLHHYDGSPFAEKVRLMLGFKSLPWLSVKIPVVMPKPDVIALTGGYRKTPLLQQGRDIWCDTALIARRLEALAPTPTLYPASAPLAPMLAMWADSTLFWTAIPYAMQPAGLAAIFAGVPPEAMKAFATDRAPFGSTIKPPRGAEATGHLQSDLAMLQAMLADGRAYLFGAQPSIADFSVAHCLWYVRRAGPMAAILNAVSAVSAWLERMLAIGHGVPGKLRSEEAVAMAAACTRFEPVAVDAAFGFQPGQLITVAPTDYGIEPSAGTLVGLSIHEVVIERHDERAGLVHVHFPRRGFQIKKQETAA